MSSSEEITRTDLISHLQEVADELGKPPTARFMNENGKYYTHNFQNEFGTWNNALQAAGLEVNQPRATQETVEDFIDDLQSVSEIVSRTPRRGDVDKHGSWSVTTYQERIPDNDEKSRWNTVLTEAGFEPYYIIYGTVEKNCEVCDSVMELKEYNADKRFCSTECFGKHRQGKYTGKDSWAYTSIDVTCETCGERFERTPAHAETSDNQFCSRDCYGKWISENITGENHPRWVHERRSYGEGWNEDKRERVRERDSRQCQACGKTELKELEDNDCKLSVHHIIPARKINDPDSRNSMNNLVTLCHAHHMAWEGIPLRPKLIDC